MLVVTSRGMLEVLANRHPDAHCELDHSGPFELICATVLSSPKVSTQEIEGFSRMANVAEEVLRIIGSNRAWMKNYGVALGLSKNPKTPLTMSLSLLGRLNDKDLQRLSMDRNVPEQLRVAARRRVVAATAKK